MDDRFCCSIHQTMLMDPVRLDGEPNVYEAETLYNVFRKSKQSPFTRTLFTMQNIKRDRRLRNEIHHIVANTQTAVNVDILEARKMNNVSIQKNLEQFLVRSETMESVDRTIGYLTYLLEDAYATRSNVEVRVYSKDYITALESDIHALHVSRDKCGYYVLVEDNMPLRMSCWGCILSCDRSRERKAGKQLIFHNSEWMLVEFITRCTDLYSKRVERLERVEWKTRRRQELIMIRRDGFKIQTRVVYEEFDRCKSYFVGEERIV